MVNMGVRVFPKWLWNILRYYSFWGFYLPISSTFGRKLTTFGIFLVQFILCFWSSFRIIEAFAEKRAVMEFIDALNFLLYYISCAFTYWIIIYDSYNNQSNERAFWKLFARNKRIFDMRQNFNERNYLITLILLVVGDCLIVIFALMREVVSEYGGRVMHFMFLCVIDHRIFFYLLHLKAIVFELRNIKIGMSKNRWQRISSSFVMTIILHTK